jgi:acyl-CoA thioester hydrolase
MAGTAARLGWVDLSWMSIQNNLLAADQTRVRVRYAETDQMGVVYHANYLVWFEVGRVELMRRRGLDYKRMEIEEGCGIAVVEATARYKAPARYDDELIVETTVTMVRGPVIRFAYRIVRVEDGLLLCEGETVHVTVGRDMKRRPLPKKYAELLGAAASHTLSNTLDGDGMQ